MVFTASCHFNNIVRSKCFNSHRLKYLSFWFWDSTLSKFIFTPRIYTIIIVHEYNCMCRANSAKTNFFWSCKDRNINKSRLQFLYSFLKTLNLILKQIWNKGNIFCANLNCCSIFFFIFLLISFIFANT